MGRFPAGVGAVGGKVRLYQNEIQAACLGFLLAHRVGFSDPARIATMILFHDTPETRTGDADSVQKMYVSHDELRAAEDQTSALGEAGKAILQMWREVDEHTTEAGRLAKDAEILEMVFTAREMVVRGNIDAQSWIDSSRSRLETSAARELLELINSADPSEWWKSMFK